MRDAQHLREQLVASHSARTRAALHGRLVTLADERLNYLPRDLELNLLDVVVSVILVSVVLDEFPYTTT